MGLSRLFWGREGSSRGQEVGLVLGAGGQGQLRRAGEVLVLSGRNEPWPFPHEDQRWAGGRQAASPSCLQEGVSGRSCLLSGLLSGWGCGFRVRLFPQQLGRA